MSMAIFLDTFRRAIGMMPDVLSKPFMEAATGGFSAVFENETPKEPQIVYYRDITDDEKSMLLKNKNFNEAIGTAKTDRIPNLFVGKGISTSEQMARNIADTTARSIQVNANQGTTTLTGTQTLASVTQYSEKDKKYRIYSVMSGSRNANQNATSMPQPTPTETNKPQTAQVTQVVNANTQGDQKEYAGGQTDVAPAVPANQSPSTNSSQPAQPQTAPATPNVAPNQPPAQTQTPQAINDIAKRVGAQVRTNKQGFPVIRKGNLLTTFNTRDKWVSFYDLTKKQRVASFRYADDNALARRANATVKSINDLSKADG